MTKEYIHGYTKIEQERLIAQASYWEDLILHELDYKDSQSMLEIGCGVGAALGIIHKKFPTLSLAGIDIEDQQIEYAKKYLPSIGIENADLRLGDATKLPWKDATFDNIFMMWIIEHLSDPLPILSEAYRVLKPGGSITLTETDLSSISIYPPSASYDFFLKCFIDYFNSTGNAYVGRILGSLLEKSGFKQINNKIIGLNYWNTQSHRELATHIDYMSEFIEPILPQIADYCGVSLQAIEKGYTEYLLTKERHNGSISHNIYRCTATK